MKVTRYGKQSREVSAATNTRLAVVGSCTSGYAAQAQLDITGYAGLQRGSMVKVALEEGEIKGLLTGIEKQRVKDEAASRKKLEKRCADSEERLDLIYELISTKLSVGARYGIGMVTARDARILKMMESLALHGANVTAVRRMVRRKKKA